MVSRELLKELKQIITEDYSICLTNQEVSEIGNNLCGFFDQLAQINYENENYRNNFS